jgi:prepilin-type N-terminal cleavage/methylation domain-containing protein
MSQSNQINHRSAFTLVEILVVVGIFALLSTVGLVSVRSSKNKTNLSNGLGYLAGAISKVQGFTRAGRSFDKTPPSVMTVPRSYGISIDRVDNKNGFKLFADFPPVGPDPIGIPHCYADGGELGCDPTAPASPKTDTVVEDNTFMSGIEVSAIQVDTGSGIVSVERIDLVYLIPSAETVLYYDDALGGMIKFAGPAEQVNVTVILRNPTSGESRSLIIKGGLIGGSVRY